MAHSIAFTSPIDDADRALMRFLVRDGGSTGNHLQVETPAPSEAPAEEEKVPQSTRVARKVRGAKAAEPKEEPAPEPEPAAEEDDEDLLGTEGPTLEDAVARATALVSDGKAPDVKAALAKVGVARVSKLPADKVEEFIDALKDA